MVHWNLWYHLHIHFHGLKSTSKGICNFNYKRRVLLVLFLKYCFVFSTFHSFASACMMHTKTHSLTILVPIFIRGQLILLPSWFHSSMIIFPYHHCNYQLLPIKKSVISHYGDLQLISQILAVKIHKLYSKKCMLIYGMNLTLKFSFI